MCCEIARISAHLLWLGTGALDLGAGTVFFHSFRERETLYNLIESLTGSRLTTSYPRVGGLAADVPEGWLGKLTEFVSTFPAFLDELDNLLSGNQIWIKRTQGVGVISGDDAVGLRMAAEMLTRMRDLTTRTARAYAARMGAARPRCSASKTSLTYTSARAARRWRLWGGSPRQTPPSSTS